MRTDNKLKALWAAALLGLAQTATAVPVVLTLDTDFFAFETWFVMTLAGDATNIAYDSWSSTIITGPEPVLDDGFVEPDTFGPGFSDLLGLDLDTLTFTWDLGPGDYEFTMFDGFGDGICCDFGDGGYSLDIDGLVVASPSGGAFGAEETIAFSIAAPVPSPGTLALIGIALAGLRLARRS